MLAAGQALSWLGDGFQSVALAVAVVLSGGGASGLGLRRVLLAAALAPLSVTGTRALQRQFPLPVTSANAVTAKAANSAG